MSPWRSDRGSAPVEFALVVPLLMGLVLAICQAGVWVLAMAHAHRVASEAARAAGRTPGPDSVCLGVARQILARELAAPTGWQARRSVVDGTPAVSVNVSVPLRVGEWIMPISGSVTAVAVREQL